MKAYILEKVEKLPDAPGCWLWTAGVATHGYACARIGGKSVRVHRLSYELFRGPIPYGLVIDHLCRVKSCVNPYHLEAVPQSTNVLRGESFAAKHAAKTHCPSGHSYSGDNLAMNAGSRRCRICQRGHVRKSRQQAKHMEASRG